MTPDTTNNSETLRQIAIKATPFMPNHKRNKYTNVIVLIIKYLCPITPLMYSRNC
jgi:hypothetical protein